MKKRSISKFKGNRAIKQNLKGESTYKLAARFRHAMVKLGVISRKESKRCSLAITQSLVRKFDAIYSETRQFKNSFRTVVREVAQDNGKNERCAAYAAKSGLEIKF